MIQFNDIKSLYYHPEFISKISGWCFLAHHEPERDITEVDKCQQHCYMHDSTETEEAQL